ncbi:putative aliphatic sulfonate family ABC transporter, periplasmic ligand-binding protein [Pandoraea apista]|nr:aliphatic sulfonate ABC transporter substrate-binding protein [Pandoraea apista]CFB61974.1 Putative aliphatic sulfonates-binding protein precursor [Pandoraea apista]VVG69457.1 putative aliphatic sulfonate family ABC transporter, periplasmic ligand-binding protein [Pandoraea apista]
MPRQIDSRQTAQARHASETAPQHPQRRRFLRRAGTAMLAGGAIHTFGAAGALALSDKARAAATPITLRIGYQKSSTLIVLAKARGTLAQALAPLNVSLTWHEFTSGLPLLEALNVGSIDFSADVADTVPVFAQAAGARIAYVARETPSPDAEAILVPQNSPIKTLADLKGKRIAVTKGAGVHYLLIAALQSVGLRINDVQPAYLTPADGRAAFASGNVDAWVTWDPFLASVERQDKVRTLTSARGLAGYQRYYLATPAFARDHDTVLREVYRTLRETGQWVRANPRDAAAQLAPIWGLDATTVEAANKRRSYDVQPVVRDALAEQQRIADVFTQAGLLPRRVDAADATLWQPPG